MTLGNEDKRRAADGQDLPPSGAEARSQRKATSMPLIWFLLGLLLMVAFVMTLAHGGRLQARSSGPQPVRVARPAGA